MSVDEYGYTGLATVKLPDVDNELEVYVTLRSKAFFNNTSVTWEGVIDDVAPMMIHHFHKAIGTTELVINFPNGRSGKFFIKHLHTHVFSGSEFFKDNPNRIEHTIVIIGHDEPPFKDV